MVFFTATITGKQLIFIIVITTYRAWLGIQVIIKFFDEDGWIKIGNLNSVANRVRRKDGPC
jgi:hypothetical protein